MIARLSLLLLAAGMATSATPARAGWCWGDHYIGRHHDLCFNNRFLQRPCPPYHGWNRPLYGWSSNYRPYYFTPQSYANTPWNYGPCRQEELLQTAAPSVGLNSYGVPISSETKSTVKPAVQQTPTLAPSVAPTYVPPAAVPQTPPAVSEPPKPSL